jgi:hypothetical protein
MRRPLDEMKKIAKSVPLNKGISFLKNIKKQNVTIQPD